MPARYVVRIEYREPAFELRLGGRDKPFEWSTEVEAEDAGAAVEVALRAFHQLAERSGVAWRRYAISAEVQPVAELPR